MPRWSIALNQRLDLRVITEYRVDWLLQLCGWSTRSHGLMPRTKVGGYGLSRIISGDEASLNVKETRRSRSVDHPPQQTRFREMLVLINTLTCNGWAGKGQDVSNRHCPRVESIHVLSFSYHCPVNGSYSDEKYG